MYKWETRSCSLHWLDIFVSACSWFFNCYKVISIFWLKKNKMRCCRFIKQVRSETSWKFFSFWFCFFSNKFVLYNDKFATAAYYAPQGVGLRGCVPHLLKTGYFPLLCEIQISLFSYTRYFLFNIISNLPHLENQTVLKSRKLFAS